MFKNLSTQVLGISGQDSETIELALSYGFRGLELDLVDFAERAKTGGLDRARRLYDSAKLKFGYFRLPVELEAADAEFRRQLTALVTLSETAAALACQRAVATIAPANDERPYHANFEFYQRRLGEVARALAPANIRLGVEFLAPASLRQDKAFEFIHALEPTLMLVSMVGQPNVGLALDLWHLYASGGSAELVRNLKPEQIVAVAVADLPADKAAEECELGDRLLPGETGVVDASKVLTTLAELGYHGPVTPTPARDRVLETKRDAVVRRAGEQLDKVWKGAGLSPSGKLATAAR